jgi:Glycosyl hydrolase family 26
MRKQVLLAVALAAALVVAAVAWAAATAVVTTGSGGSWPSTYFNGPLGNNEILPAVKGHTLLSLWSGADGCNVSCGRALIQRRITDIGHAPPLIGYQCDDVMTVRSCALDHGPNDLSENYVHSLGAIPLITWNAGDRDYPGVAAGNYDSDIDTAATRLKAFGHRVMIRLYHEFEQHAPWNTTDFINAWRHVVNRFRADGATNVGFWWCPGESAGGALRTQINQSYPGDQYVDWVGSDGYNWDTNTAYNATRPGWNEFSWTFNYQISGSPSMEQQWGPEKPFVVGETGTKYDTTGVPSGHTVDPNRKANWYRNIPSAAASMPYLIGVQFFDVNAIDTPPDDWQVDSTCASAGNNCPTPPTPGAIDSNTYSGFMSMADSSQFSGGVAVVVQRSGPRLSAFALAPRSFRAARSGPSLLTRGRLGTQVSYTLSARAAVAFTVERVASGRRSLPVRGIFKRAGRKGANNFRFSGRIANRTLTPGNYRLIARPTANGRTGKAQSVSFRILRRRRRRAALLRWAYWSSFVRRRMSGRAPLWACPCRGPLLDQRLPDVPSRCP